MERTVTVLPEGRKIPAQTGEFLLNVLRKYGLAPDAPCGGAGICGKCSVHVDGELVRSCTYRIEKDISVRLTAQEDTTRVLTGGSGAEVEMKPWGDGAMLAYDIGTTTVVCYLLE